MRSLIASSTPSRFEASKAWNSCSVPCGSRSVNDPSGFSISTAYSPGGELNVVVSMRSKISRRPDPSW